MEGNYDHDPDPTSLVDEDDTPEVKHRWGLSLSGMFHWPRYAMTALRFRKVYPDETWED